MNTNKSQAKEKEGPLAEAGHIMAELSSALISGNDQTAAEVILELHKFGLHIQIGTPFVSLAAQDLKTSTLQEIAIELSHRSAGVLLCTFSIDSNNHESWKNHISGSRRLVNAMAGSLSDYINAKFKGETNDDQPAPTKF